MLKTATLQCYIDKSLMNKSALNNQSRALVFKENVKIFNPSLTIKRIMIFSKIPEQKFQQITDAQIRRVIQFFRILKKI